MYNFGFVDKLATDFVLSKEQSHKIAKTKKAFKFCNELEKKGINYDYCIRHKEAVGCVDYSRWNSYLGDDYAVGKHLFVREKKGEKKYLIVTNSSKQIDLSKLKEILGCRKLEFVSPDEMEDLIKATPGNVSIFNMMYDYNKDVELIMDEELFNVSKVAFHPLYNGMSIFMSLDECFSFLATIGRDATILSLPSKSKQYVRR